jgi:uracil-DNA glycosylase
MCGKISIFFIRRLDGFFWWRIIGGEARHAIAISPTLPRPRADLVWRLRARPAKENPMPKTRLDALFAEVRACSACAAHLPLGPRPVLRGRASARLIIISQAPGTKVHETGLSFNDRSGDRLREWLGIDRESFYDERRVAILPMGLCYPGRYARGGDLPPRPECAPLWHPRLLAAMPEIRLTLLIGRYAQAYYLGKGCKPTLTATVAAYADYLPRFLPLPHPSPRNRFWQTRNPWFAAEVLPLLRQQVAAALRDTMPRAISIRQPDKAEG